jgi:hypothetical protein
LGRVTLLAGDETQRTIKGLRTRAGAPDFGFSEMIAVSGNGAAKNHMSHWHDKGRLVRRTLINEALVTTDWRAYDAPEFHAYRARDMP